MAISLQADSTLPQGYILVDGQKAATVSTTGLSATSILGTIAPNVITNAQIASNAAIDGTKINPNFGTQDLTCNRALIQTTAAYNINQNVPYLIAGTSSFSNSGTDWGSYGFQHRLKSDSGGIGRITVDGQRSTDGIQELFCINTGGNVGIGTASPLTVAGYTALTIRNTTNGGICQVRDNSVDLRIQTQGTSVGSVGTYSNHPVVFMANSEERMRLLAEGSLLVGQTVGQVFATDNTDGVELNPAGWIGASRRFAEAMFLRRRDNNGPVVLFYRNNANVGSIAVDTNNTGYNTSSDYRLKDNPQLITNGLATINQIKPVTFTWKSDGSSGEGFIAHELQQVVPRAVTGEKDAVDSEGKPQYQGVDASKLVPFLVSAIQELKTKVESLEAEITQLKTQ
jgi:hypothetical protein